MLVMGLIIPLRINTEGARKTSFNVYLHVALQIPTVAIGIIMAFGQLLAIPAALDNRRLLCGRSVEKVKA
jgi:hypothetical protein